MAATKPAILSPKRLCFGLGLFGTVIVAMFWMYPALLSLFGGGEIYAPTDSLTWSTPLLFLALLMTGWLLLGLMTLLRPGLVVKSLPEGLKNGLIEKHGAEKHGNEPEGARAQFKHGRQFVLNSLAGRVLIWPPALFALLLLIPVFFVGAVTSLWSAWLAGSRFRVLAFLIPAMFVAALLMRIFTPNAFSAINRENVQDGKAITDLFPHTALPFVGGLLTAIMVILVMSITGLLPHPENTSQTAQRAPRINNDAAPNSAGNSPDIKTRSEETERKDVSNVQWEQHFLALMGENHVPVADAFSTPFATYFRIDQPGYIPSGKLGPLDKEYSGPIECAPDITPKSTNINSVAKSARDADEATNSLKPIVRRNPNCPRDLGTLWSTGSYVYDATGNQLAGFEFKDNTHAYVVKAANGSQYLVFPEGGFGPKDNPSVNKYVPRYVFVRTKDPLGNANGASGTDDSKMKIKPYVPGAPDLPVFIDHKIIDDQDLAEDIADYLPNVDEVISALDKINKNTNPKTGSAPDDIIIISRAPLPKDNDQHRKRVEAFTKKINRTRQASNITFIHLGFLPQICHNQTVVCKALNRRSTIIYTQIPR